MMEKEMTTKLNTDEARALVERLTGYTPGPWRVSPTDDTTVICQERTVVAEIDGDYNEPDLWPVMENNARLIAAAPDLHAALTAALAEIERLREGPTVHESARVLIPVFEKRHEDWARSKGRNPKDYVSHHTTTLDALRALAGETDQ